ncbi:MAG: toll/interleukin-1 receptor domain-containing protein [Bacilli bacterium]|nr:toll/interleukin-1 receptor domain-containing protein [Bacilli bacterium]
MSKTNVFVSYGHNCFDLLARRIVGDLVATGEFDVFFDVDCLDKGDWEELITQGIERCDYFLFCVSEKAVSHKGYCLNELSRACELQKEIIPVLLDESYVPLSITRLQRLNLTRALDSQGKIIEDVLRPTYEKLLRLLRGQEKLGFFNSDFALSNQLQTFSSYEIGAHVTDFVGREKAILDFDGWLHNPTALPIYLLEAAPGVGKSALCSVLSVRYPQNVAGIHFCTYNNQAKTDAKNIINNLACQLSYRNEDFASSLREALKRENLEKLDAKRLFEVLLLEPGSKVSFPSTQVLVIDALDEAVDNGKNEIAEILLSYQNALPKWLRVYCSTRPQENVTVYFRSCHVYRIDDSGKENEADIRAFYEKALPRKLDEEESAILMKKSHGSFLYANCIANSVKAKELSLDDVSSFPDGIYSYYALWFNRIFSSFPYEEARPVLAVLSIASSAVSTEFLSEALNKQESDILRVAAAVSSFFRLDEGNLLTPIHKSILDWLCGSSCPTSYRLSPKEGAKILRGYIEAKRGKGRGWKKDPFVILDYGRVLKILDETDDLCDLMRDDEYLRACFASPLYTHYQSISTYFDLLSFLYKEDEDYASDIYDSQSFRDLFAAHRKRIYNSGLFLKLKECGFGRYLSRNKPQGSIEFEIGELYFYYISLSFPEAYESLQDIQRRFPLETIPLESRCELERMTMLVCRKIVAFKDVVAIGPQTIEDAKKAGNPFEESLAYLTLSKVYCRQLRKEECYEAADQAVEILSRRVKEETDELGTQIGDHLFLSEDLRVYADACIWHKDLGKAKGLLDQAFGIYALYDQFDRYYPRTLYTSLFYEIVSGAPKQRVLSVAKKLRPLLNQANDDYDMAQYCFLMGLHHYLCGEYDRAEEQLLYALEKDKALSVPLERLEVETLLNKVYLAQGKDARYDNRHNEDTDVWIAYVREYIDELWRSRHGS